MRINEEFAVARKSEIRTYKPKYFIVSEGSCSEPQYFAGLNNSIISERFSQGAFGKSAGFPEIFFL